MLFWPHPAPADLQLGVSPMKIPIELDPGARQTRSIEVRNSGSAAVRVLSSVSDWTTTREGGMTFLAPGSIDRSAAEWTQVDLAEFSLSPKESRVVRLSVQLPDSARGSYWAIVFFEAEPRDRPVGVTLRSRARIGTTIYLTAKGTEAREDAITGMEVAPGETPGRQLLRVALTNRGNVHYYPGGWLQVLGPDGQTAFEMALPRRVLLPLADAVYQMEWEPELSGPCRLLATFDVRQETLLQGVLEFTVPVSTATTLAEPDTAPETATSESGP